MVWPTRAGEVDGRVEVEQPRVDEARIRRGDGLGVGGGERLLDAVLGEAERAPEPAGLLDRHPGLRGDLEGVEDRRLAQDRALEPVPGVLRLRSRHGAGAPGGRAGGRVGRVGGCEEGHGPIMSPMRWRPSRPAGRRRARARRRRRRRRPPAGPATSSRPPRVDPGGRPVSVLARGQLDPHRRGRR